LDGTSREHEAPSSPGDKNDPICDICSDAGWVGLDVPHGHPDFGRALPCECKKDLSTTTKIQRLQRYSNLGPLTRLSFDDLIPVGIRPDEPSQQAFNRSFESALEYTRTPKGWLVFVGPSGTGKTHLAAAISNELMSQGKYVFFIVVPDLLDHLRLAFNPEAELQYDDLFEQVRETPFLVLDDLGANNLTNWATEKLFQIINHRFTRELPTIITTNNSLDQLNEAIRTRITDTNLSQINPTGVGTPTVNTLYEMVNLPAKLQTMTFESFEAERPELAKLEQESLTYAFNAASNYAKKPEGWLVLMGDEFCGKTHLAAAVANNLLKQKESVLFVTVPELLDHLRSTFAPDSTLDYDDLFESVKTVPFLVLDDLGAHSSTPWARDKLFQIVNHRYNSMLPLIVTMRSDLTNTALDSRLAARLGDNTSSNMAMMKVRGYFDGKPPPSMSQNNKNPTRRYEN
jgi:DNA replication protein DnaC